MVGAVLRRQLQPQLQSANAVEDQALLNSQRLNDSLDAVQLDIQEGALEFVGAGAVGRKGLKSLSRPVQ